MNAHASFAIGFLLASLSAACGGSTSDERGARNEVTCGAGAYGFGGHCYALLNPASWLDARTQCEGLGPAGGTAHLVTIGTPAEQQFLKGLATFNGKFSGGPYWIGLAVGQDGSSKWVDGEAVSYANWASGEPLSNTDSAAQMRDDGTWKTEPATSGYPAICEAEPE